MSREFYEVMIMEKGWIVGSWRFVKTHQSIPAPFRDIYHFSDDGIHIWETPYLGLYENQYGFCQYSYIEKRDGYWVCKPRVSEFFPCWKKGDDIVSLGKDNNYWWLERISKREDSMVFFVDESGALIRERQKGSVREK